MKSTVVSTTAIIGLLATFFSQAVAVAIPAEADAKVEARQSQDQAFLSFSGATPEAFYNLIVPLNVVVPIDNPLSISSISLSGSPNLACSVQGVDGSNILLPGGGSSRTVAPPQAQVSVNCIEFV